MRTWSTGSLGVAGAMLAVGGCGLPATTTCQSFSLTLDPDRRGDETPVAAAESSVADGDVDDRLPRTGWREVSTDATGSTLRSGTATLHVVRGTDGTWQVDAGERCRPPRGGRST